MEKGSEIDSFELMPLVAKKLPTPSQQMPSNPKAGKSARQGSLAPVKSLTKKDQKKNMRKVFRASLLTLMAIVSFGIMASAQTSPASVPGININNFGQMADNLYRGAQPGESDYKALANMGIKTIIDLRNDYEPYARSSAEAAGLKYVNIPMNGVSAPSDADVAKFLQVVNDPASGKVFFHCKAGIHRAGTMGAIYRINHDGWDYDKAYAEMKNYQFSAGLFHGALKSFVKKYADRMASQRAATTRASAEAPVANF